MDQIFLDLSVSDWLNIAARWAHVLFAITWVGTTWFFAWLDRRFTEDEKPPSDPANFVTGELWMVHSGGFYRVEKQRFRAGFMPGMLHWFKWEAGLTWLTGASLLYLRYYQGGALTAGIHGNATVATAVGIGLLAVGWVAYDLFWNSRLGENELLGGAICFAIVVGAASGLRFVMDPRAAFIHIGALFGTIMAANVWIRIIPGQKRIVSAVTANQEPDLRYAKRAKQRSRHNTFMTVPLVFIMLSGNNFSQVYGHKFAWAFLGGFILVGWLVRKIINVFH